MKKQNLGFNTWGNNSTYGRTTVACGLGRLRNAVGSTTRIYNYCNNFSSDPLACTLNLTRNSGSNSGSNKTIPSSPTITSLTTGNGELIVNFTAPTNDGGSPITDYLYSIDNGISFTSAGVTTTPITITGLTSGTDYNVVIRAINSIGTSGSSNSVSGTPTSTVPNPPINLSATNGNTDATISFTAGSDDGSAITDYLYSTDGVTYISSGYAASPITITGLTNDVSYSITLKAVNANGNSIASNAVSATPNATLMIQTFTTVETTSWTAPYGVTSVDYLLVSGGGGGGGSYDGGAGGGGGGGLVLYGTNYPVIPGTTYTVIVGDGGPGGRGVGNGGGDGTSYPGGVTQFGDILANGGGAGGGSLINRTGTGGSQGNAGTSTSPTGGQGGRSPQNANGGGGGGGMGSAGETATSASNAAGGDGIPINITGTDVTYGAGGSGGIRLVNADGSDASPNTGNGGQGSGAAFGDGSTGGKGGSGIVILKYYASSPIITSVVSGNTQLTVNFTAPTSIASNPITDYQYSTDNGVSFTSAGVATSPITITGLTNGTTYDIVIRAINSNLISGSSNSVSGIPSTVPDPPTSLSATDGDTQATISFTAGSNGGSAITNYKYSLNGGAFIAFSPVDTSSPVTISGLTNGLTYSITLKAVNANGESIASSAVSATPTGPAPSAPTALSGVGGNQAAYILFTQIGTITNYEYSTDDGDTFLAFDPPQTYSPVEINTLSSDGVTRLTNGTTYTVKLKAVNSGALSTESLSVDVVPTITSLSSTNRIIYLDANNTNSYPGSGTTWANLDSSGNYSATLQNSPTFDNINKWFTFDGINQIAQIAAADAINPTTPFTPFTIQIWARVNTASPNFGAWDGLISKQYGASSYDGYSLNLSSTNTVALKMNGRSIDGTYYSSAGVYSNNWALYTIVVRFGGGSGSPSYAYVSTRRVVTGNNGESNMPIATAPLQFPRGIQDGPYNYCPADVGAFYLYNTALSQEDIIRNYDATKPRYI